jgi:hypothetical protein
MDSTYLGLCLSLNFRMGTTSFGQKRPADRAGFEISSPKTFPGGDDGLMVGERPINISGSLPPQIGIYDFTDIIHRFYGRSSANTQPGVARWKVALAALRPNASLQGG